jgi:hypothetical protein
VVHVQLCGDDHTDVSDDTNTFSYCCATAAAATTVKHYTQS